MHSSVLLVALLLYLPGSTHSFKPLFPPKGSISHCDITMRAVLRKTAEVCKALAAASGQGFSLKIDDSLTVSEVLRACSSGGTSNSILSSDNFHGCVVAMCLANAAVDQRYMLSSAHHFDDEAFKGGRDIITAGMTAVKASVKQEKFISGRLTLGAIFHTLQDFYSHSNWVELGYKVPYKALIRLDLPLKNLAGPNTPTCKNCIGGNCNDNLLPEVIKKKLLTSGYFSMFFKKKPAGKCSHGGAFDRTSKRDPKGGINKDVVKAEHGFLHLKAANMAVKATMDLLEDIRGASGDKTFLRLICLTPSSALCFVIDTTGSMSDDIQEAKRVSFSIIDSTRGTQQEPSLYILVPFNDPDFGPLIMTSDPDVFKQKINELGANGGGDLPEMCLSALQLALTAAPPSSEIFVFTDASAKDAHLKSAIFALIDSTKSVVSFMITGNPFRGRRRRALHGSGTRLYRDLAQASGGLAIEVMRSELPQATIVIEDTLANAMVTVLQAVSDPGMPNSFNFTVDSSMKNLTAYITGASSLTFLLTNPLGVSQSSSQHSGPLGSFTKVGNLYRFRFSAEHQMGSWEIDIQSNDPYNLKVIGQSSVNFIYNFVEKHEGAHGDYSLKTGRILAGDNVSLLVTVTGNDTAKVSEITLTKVSGSTEVKGSVQSLGSSFYLVTFIDVPGGVFALRLKGEDGTMFQRQASTQVTTSSLSVTIQAHSSVIEPGSAVSIPFTVSETTTGIVNGTRTFTIRVTNDRSYATSSPATVSIAASGDQVNGTVMLTVPAGAVSGTDVTLTIEAENAGATDTNYAVLRFSVVAKVTDFTRPVCQVINTSGICPSSPSLCSSVQWEFSANLTDGINGTGIELITIRQGNGTLTTSSVVGAGGENVTLAAYSASCCSQTVELVAVDRAGNVGMCVVQAKRIASTTSAAPVTNSTTVVATSPTGGRPLTLPTFPRVTDFTRPVCQVINTSGICPSSPSLCSSVQWEFSANLTDGINGTGIELITIRQGNGTLTTSSVVGAGGENVTLAAYSASCCSQTVQLVALDGAGNVGMCVVQAKRIASTTPAAPVTNSTTVVATSPTGGRPLTLPTFPRTTDSASTTSAPMMHTSVPVTTRPTVYCPCSTGGRPLTLSQYLWVTILVFLLWK